MGLRSLNKRTLMTTYKLMWAHRQAIKKSIELRKKSEGEVSQGNTEKSKQLTRESTAYLRKAFVLGRATARTLLANKKNTPEERHWIQESEKIYRTLSSALRKQLRRQ